MGYNPGKPGRRRFHPLLTVAARTRLCPAYRFPAGGTVTATEWQEPMEDAQRWFGERKVLFHRGYLGLYHDAVMSWHEEAAEWPKFLFKQKLTSRVRTALGQVREESWQGCATLQPCQVAEGLIQLTGWKTARRMIFARKLLGVIRGPENAKLWDRHKHQFAVYVTNLPTTCNA